MNIAQAIFLGIVQGLTEFLPVSSSGHLVFFQSLFGLKEPQLLFDIMLHLGTLMAVFVFFRRDLCEMVQGIVRSIKEKKVYPSARLCLWIVVATIPTGLMGVLLNDWFESLFSRPRTVGITLLITGSFLWLTRLAKQKDRKVEEMTWIDSILIGIAQGLAITPGISRSGATISSALFCGLNRELAGRFSFLLSIPAILGATVLEIRGIGSPQGLGLNLLGMVVAFGVGFFSLKFLMKIIKNGKISIFSYYCWAVGILILFLTK
ncbi:MAG: undecaprenyl-diphosphatase UppP [Deltaproteobacteria bacterium]|nr:MAG: undecaprenyl-diphosphatase UppP [Deltaproteobacteria bacterium]